jgi:hypothetical protein
LGKCLFRRNGATSPTLDYRNLNVCENLHAGITLSLLSIELGYSRTQINNVTFTSAGCNCGLLLRKCNTSDTKNIVLGRRAYSSLTYFETFMFLDDSYLSSECTSASARLNFSMGLQTQ